MLAMMARRTLLLKWWGLELKGCWQATGMKRYPDDAIGGEKVNV